MAPSTSDTEHIGVPSIADNEHIGHRAIVGHRAHQKPGKTDTEHTGYKRNQEARLGASKSRIQSRGRKTDLISRAVYGHGEYANVDAREWLALRARLSMRLLKRRSHYLKYSSRYVRRGVRLQLSLVKLAASSSAGNGPTSKSSATATKHEVSLVFFRGELLSHSAS